MKQEVQVPQIGESVSSGILATWLKKDGASVAEGDELFELETDKATLAVPSPAAGVLRIEVEEATEVQVGQTVAVVDTAAAASSSPEDVPPQEKVPAADSGTDVSRDTVEADGRDEGGTPALSPAVRRIVAEHNLNPALIRGSGPDGRITKQDALAAAGEGGGTRRGGEDSTEGDATTAVRHRQPSQPQSVPMTAAAASPAAASTASAAERQRRVKMSGLRKRIAENLVQSKQGAAHLTTFNEVDMSAVMDLRARHKEHFAEKHGVKLGFMSFFVSATVRALQQYQEVNAFVDGSDILYNDYYNIGVALSSDKGLIVPVIRDADRKSFAVIETEIAGFIDRARTRRLGPDELTGGTFSISNGGVFGSMLSTPIPSPPQTGVLGMHSIQKRAVIVDDQIVIRPMMYLALTYDHRIIDGREAVGFLGKIRQLIEDPTQMLLDI
ncbi:MAG: 2-oxoglutarate dehydrogenase complex dihydrolipoyllysine-residue succinyltransferase [Spirochaetaceae bacterium]|nr:MAG: 2-oxoglutarate dehydrogenase complex dihydrolipoyllysine-residue succinyltransferase [Spirochaetaceae bacterium]